METQKRASFLTRFTAILACCWLLAAISTSALAFARRADWVFDPPPANRNGKGDAGERVLPRLRLLNDRPGAAQNVVATFTTNDPDITVVAGEVTYASWSAGQARNIGFKIDIDPAATTHAADATVTVTADSPGGGP
ncbi:hypothetical protein CMK11_05500 [Candidatus Poribacteria bacterium]|nr:hypothetical protein [Candidatus Poribacteria bacterium]